MLCVLMALILPKVKIVMKEKQKILLTGASGTVGYEALKQLITKGIYELTVFDIKTPKSQKLFEPYQDKINLVYGDISDQKQVAEVVKGQQKIIHLAAVIPPLADEQPQLAKTVNTEGTKHILAAMEKDCFLLYASSVSVYGDRIDNPMIYRTDPLKPSPNDHYAQTKIAAENSINTSNRKWTIFRLSAIMGYGNHKISGLMFHMPLETCLEITTPEDTARAFVNGLEHEHELVAKTFNLGGGANNRTTYKAFLQRSFDAFGLGKLDFPNKAFAEKNFHCGYYADGDELEEIVHFRKDTLDTYFTKVQNTVSAIKRCFTKLFSPIVKYILLKKSEPYTAYKRQDSKLMNYFFKT